MVVGPSSPEGVAAERQRTLPFERHAMARGAMIIVKIMAFESLLLAVNYRTRVALLAVESRGGRDE
jgi:hypothetical protein